MKNLHDLTNRNPQMITRLAEPTSNWGCPFGNVQNSDSQKTRDISIASYYLRLKRYQMIISHAIHQSKKFWNCARWQNYRFLRNYLTWRTKPVENQETKCKFQWRQSRKLSKMFTYLKRSHFPSKNRINLSIEIKVWTTNFYFLFLKKIDEIWFFSK